ncbi:hypothetical protein GCM10020256_62890 [Streptomyces thermocoprophilus]
MHGGTLGTGVGDGETRTRENQTAGGSRSSDDLLDHLFLLAGKSDPSVADRITSNEEGVMGLRAYRRIHSSQSFPYTRPISDGWFSGSRGAGGSVLRKGR